MRCTGQAPLHQHADTGIIHALAGDGQTTYTVALGDVAQCSCPAGQLGQRCFHIISAESCFASFFTAPWAARAQRENLFEHIQARLVIVANTLPDMAELTPDMVMNDEQNDMLIDTHDPPRIALVMTPAIAAALASIEETTRQHRRPAA